MEENEYIVNVGDTIQRVAVKFNTTPGDLAKENKLSVFQPMIFPGQKLIIPKFKAENKESVSSKTESKVLLRAPHKSHPGTATRISAPLPTTKSYSIDSDTDEVVERQFVKLKSVRIVGKTLKKCPGTLLITPKFLVFDPERKRMTSDSDEVITTSDPLCNVGLYILLESVVALNTHSKLEELVEMITSVDQESDGCDCNEESNNEIDNIVKEFTCSPLLYLVVRASPLSDSYTGDQLPLISTLPNSSNNSDEKTFIFGVPDEKIEEAYSFLIISGIGASSSSSGGGDGAGNRSCSPNTAAGKKGDHHLMPPSGSGVTDSSDSGIGHRSRHNTDDELSISNDHFGGNSVVAEALKEFEEVRFQPQLRNGTSNVLTDQMLEDICRSLPTHLSDCNLYLVYQTGRHGYSLGTIYRKMAALNDCPTLLLIRDCTNHTFGAYMSNNVRISTHYYGNGETFVFHWCPLFKKYEWTRENSFFFKGDPHSFHIGAKSGHSAIWFEDTLKYGRSEPTDTFHNPILSGNADDDDDNDISKSVVSNEKGAVLLSDQSSSSAAAVGVTSSTSVDGGDEGMDSNLLSSLSSSTSKPALSTTTKQSKSLMNVSCAKMEYNFVIESLEVWRFVV